MPTSISGICGSIIPGVSYTYTFGTSEICKSDINIYTVFQKLCHLYFWISLVSIDWLTILSLLQSEMIWVHLPPYLNCVAALPDNKKFSYRWQTARHIYRSVKVTKHGTIRNVRYGFLLVCYSNLVPKTRSFSDIRFQKILWPWNPGQRSLKVIESVTIW